ncbi:hypothetical protein [Wukongibacter sp. M2B1]|uniref:hypothetical protein n=1 Tax=Wukongibacter sp. M2B1 TaxID=3088895 RepID=UPI003D7B7446
MSKKYRKIHLAIIERILPAVSYFLIVLSMGLEIAVRKSMGIHRDLVFRKGIIEKTVLSVEKLNIYKYLILAGIGICTVIIILRRYKINDRLRKYIFLTVGLSILLLMMIISYNKVSLIAYPWMVISVGIMVICQYIRIINGIVNKGNSK